MSNVSKAHIQELLDQVRVHVNTVEVPTKHVIATAWLDDFYLGCAISKAVDPTNFNEQLGIQYATKDVMQIVEKQLWDFEGYALKFKL